MTSPNIPVHIQHKAPALTPNQQRIHKQMIRDLYSEPAMDDDTPHHMRNLAWVDIVGQR